MTINEYYGFPEGTIARLDSRLLDMLPNDIEISDISNAYCHFDGKRILKFPKDVKYTRIHQLTWGSYGILGIVDINTENCTDFAWAFENDGTHYLPIINISGAENSDRVRNMFDRNLITFGIKGLYKLNVSPYNSAPTSAKLFQYEGKYKKYYSPFIIPLPSTTRKIAFGPTEISAYICDNLVYVTSGDVTIGGIPATYRYGGEWYITKDFTGEEKSQDLEVRYNGELLGYASPLNDGEFYFGENQPVIYEGEALNNIMASNTNWTYDSSIGYWVANSLPATMVLNASGRIKITANPNRSSYNQITVSDANGNTLGSYTSSFSKIVSNPTDSITIKATGYSFDGKPTISKVVVNTPDIPNDRPLLCEWTPAGSGMYAITPVGDISIPSDVTQVYAGDYLDILGIDAHSSTLQKFIKYDNSISSKRTDFSQAWNRCSALTEFPMIDTSNGTSFSMAWSNCTSLTTFPKLNVSNGTDFFAAWDGCSALTKFPLLNTSKGTNFSCAWRDCTSLTTFPKLNVSNGTNFFAAWDGCRVLTTFPTLDLSNGTDFSQAWYDCQSLTEFPLLDVSKGTNFRSAWNTCNALTEFPALDLSSGTNFEGAWKDCRALTTIPQLDMSNGTNFINTWNGCSALTTIGQLDLSNGTDFTYAWLYCENLTNLGGFGAIKENIDLYASSKLTVDSIMNVINQAATVTGKTMTFGYNNLIKLTDEQKAVATNKGWTLA